jgi:hypothetical protein
MSDEGWDGVRNSKKCSLLHATEDSFPDSTGLSRRKDHINRNTKFEKNVLLRMEDQIPSEGIVAGL